MSGMTSKWLILVFNHKMVLQNNLNNVWKINFKYNNVHIIKSYIIILVKHKQKNLLLIYHLNYSNFLENTHKTFGYWIIISLDQTVIKIVFVIF